MKTELTIDEQLKKHPRLRARMEAILAITEGEDIADVVEEKMIEEARLLGK